MYFDLSIPTLSLLPLSPRQSYFPFSFPFPWASQEHEEQDQTGLWLGTKTLCPISQGSLQEGNKSSIWPDPKIQLFFLLTLNWSHFPCTSCRLCIGYSQIEIKLGSFYTLYASQSNLPRRDTMKSKRDLIPWLHRQSSPVGKSAV